MTEACANGCPDADQGHHKFSCWDAKYNTDPTAIDIDVDPTKQRMTGYTAHGNKPFSVPFMTEIAENLWQGGCADGLMLPAFVKHIVSLYLQESYTVKHQLQTDLRVFMYDSLQQSTEQVLEIASWVNSCRNTGPVLVHCQAGLNRSSLVAGTALVMNNECTGPEAVELIREARSPACLCNPMFEDWLKKLKFDDTDHE